MFKKFLFSIAMLAPVALLAEISQGERLERQKWEYTKSHNWKELEKMTAPHFQASLFDGARNKEQYMNLAIGSDISDYTLSDFLVTEGPGIAIVTYEVDLSETIEGKRITSKASRLSVWQNNDGKWQIIAHAVLIPVPAADASAPGASPAPPTSPASNN